MDSAHFDCLTRAVSTSLSRRSLAGTLGFGALARPFLAEGKRHKRRHRRKERRKKNVTFNDFGCVNVGGFCKNAEQCCSGICEGKKDKRKCKAHGTGACDQEGPGLCTSPNPELLKCNNSNDCACIRTTAGSNFCYSVLAGGSDCADCQQDADCEALGFPPGSACAPTSEGGCAGLCESGMACLAPCGYEPPEPE